MEELQKLANRLGCYIAMDEDGKWHGFTTMPELKISKKFIDRWHNEDDIVEIDVEGMDDWDYMKVVKPYEY